MIRHLGPSSRRSAAAVDPFNTWLTLKLTEATKDDASSSEDSGTTDLSANQIGVNVTPSQGAAARSALLYRWPVEVPPLARRLELAIPLVSFSVRTNGDALRFAVLSSTAQGTSDGFAFDVGTTASADRMGVVAAWAATSFASYVVGTPTGHRGGVNYTSDLGTPKLYTATMMDLDASDQSGRYRADTSLKTLTGIADSTLYLAIVVHTPGGIAKVFTLADHLRYRWVVGPA